MTTMRLDQRPAGTACQLQWNSPGSGTRTDQISGSQTQCSAAPFCEERPQGKIKQQCRDRMGDLANRPMMDLEHLPTNCLQIIFCLDIKMIDAW